ncbi:MAG: competence/damage-inducible protein A [Bacteroides sp.]|nr:competence/damage-inducible protein A [Bacteroides sp.]
MFTEIITIGDELLIGQVVDTNSAWISKELNKIGIEVIRITSIRDLETEISSAIDNAFKKADLVLLTGGLGPTKDDITKQTLCKYFHTRLVFNESVYLNIQNLLSGRVPLNNLNKEQAYVPEKAVIINNRVGTAPITWFNKEEKVLISMPGVPQEMMTGMKEQILPRIQKHFQTDCIIHKTLTVKNYPESVLAETLESWEKNLPSSLNLAYLPKPGMIRLRLTARGKDQELLTALLSKETVRLKNILGSNLFDENDEPIKEIIGKMLINKKITVSTAESCTGGNIAARLTSVPGSSGYFAGSIVAYSNEVKTSLLHVKQETLDKNGAVSEETVVEMVQGAMKTLKTDCAIATSGIAGPGGGTPQKPVGTIWIAAAYRDKVITMKQESDRGRELNVERAVNNAFLLLHELLM